jgi:hypothetical protein
MTWYRHRVVKFRRIPGVRFADDPRVEEAKAHLRKVAAAEMADPGHRIRQAPPGRDRGLRGPYPVRPAQGGGRDRGRD